MTFTNTSSKCQPSDWLSLRAANRDSCEPRNQTKPLKDNLFEGFLLPTQTGPGIKSESPGEKSSAFRRGPGELFAFLRLIRSAVQRTSRLQRFRLKLVCRGCRLVRRLGELRDNAVMRCLLVGEGEAKKFGLTPHRANKDEAEWRSAAEPPCGNGDARKTCNVDLGDGRGWIGCLSKMPGSSFDICGNASALSRCCAITDLKIRKYSRRSRTKSLRSGGTVGFQETP